MIGLGIKISAYDNLAHKITAPLDIPFSLPFYFDFSLSTGDDGDAITTSGDLSKGLTNLGSGGTTYLASPSGGVALDTDTFTTRLNSFRFDGSDDKLTLANGLTTTNKSLTAFAAYRTDDVGGTSSSDDDCLFSKTDTNGQDKIVLTQANVVQFRANANTAVNITTNNTSNSTVSYSFSDDAVEVLVLRRDTSGNVSLYNKAGDFIGYSATTDGANFECQSICDLGANEFGGFVGEIGMYDADIGDQYARDLARYLNERWG